MKRLLLLPIALAINSMTANAAGTMSMDESTVSRMLADWPAEAKKAANDTIASYGQPDEATPTRLVWHDNGPWKRTIVYREEVDHRFPMPHKDVLEQFIDYKVPPDKVDELAAYDGSVIVERTKGEISARCDKEGANFLALNLANDIVMERISVEEARQKYAETIEKMKAGEKPPYLSALQFRAQSGTADPDMAVQRTAMKESSSR
jgi:hypothetical protein